MRKKPLHPLHAHQSALGGYTIEGPYHRKHLPHHARVRRHGAPRAMRCFGWLFRAGV